MARMFVSTGFAASLALAAGAALAQNQLLPLSPPPISPSNVGVAISGDGSVVLGRPACETCSGIGIQWRQDQAWTPQEIGPTWNVPQDISVGGMWVVGSHDGTPPVPGYLSGAFRKQLAPAPGPFETLFSVLQDPLDRLNEAVAISDDGQVIVINSSRAFEPDTVLRWTSAGGVFLSHSESGAGISPNGRFIAGTARGIEIGDPSEPAIWFENGPAQRLGLLPGTSGGIALGVSDDGRTVVGVCYVGFFLVRPFIWRQGIGISELATLTPGDLNTVPRAITPDGSMIVGTSASESVYWNASLDVDRIENLVPIAQLVNWSELRDAVDVSNDGRSIVGHGLNTNGNDQPFLLTLVGAPCPADFNHDGQGDFFDYLDFVAAYSADAPDADFNDDGVIDFFDYLDFAAAYDAGC
ncbi:MAG: hypothetical protein SFZ23_11440 [Planctomycetota bacterium]|nr:hypothetical protein [Planctomycetota bacterium]